MVSSKRIIIATVLGLVFGVVSWLLAGTQAPQPIPWFGAVCIILARGVTGFAIGISAWRIGWWLHGLVMGLIFSLPLAFGGLWAGFAWLAGFWGTLVAGLVFGFLIELVTVVGFKAEMPGSSS